MLQPAHSCGLSVEPRDKHEEGDRPDQPPSSLSTPEGNVENLTTATRISQTEAKTTEAKTTEAKTTDSGRLSHEERTRLSQAERGRDSRT